MSTGIAGWGLRTGTVDRPTPLPVQALDHATGYLMAAAVLSGIASRRRDGRGTAARLSLARTAAGLERVMSSRGHARPRSAEPAGTASVAPAGILDTPWGAATLLTPPFAAGAATLRWDRGPSELGSDAAAW
jgi:crotonobetainyl-CoA:carnitine CoA-transferase CaiB-like acyl-CoA transferase